MTSLRQLEANRQNARRSTGPRTDEGKLQSRRNALRHGLTAETVIEVLEDIEDYKAFEATIIADYDACTAVERELVLRLASLLWRIRRATAIETDLLRIQAEILRDQHHAAAINHDNEHPKASVIHSALRQVIRSGLRRCSGNGSGHELANDTEGFDELAPDDGDIGPARDLDRSHDLEPSHDLNTTRGLTRSFLRLSHLDPGAFDRLGRYEAALWRQALQTMLALRSIRYR